MHFTKSEIMKSTRSSWGEAKNKQSKYILNTFHFNRSKGTVTKGSPQKGKADWTKENPGLLDLPDSSLFGPSTPLKSPLSFQSHFAFWETFFSLASCSLSEKRTFLTGNKDLVTEKPFVHCIPWSYFSPWWGLSLFQKLLKGERIYWVTPGGGFEIQIR